MADLREVFPILQDDVTGAGEAPISRIEGEVAAGKEGLIGFSWKDSSGNVVLPQLTAEGKVPVDTEALAGTCVYADGLLAEGSQTVGVYGDVVTLVLGLNKYNNIMMQGNCTRTARFKLIHIDDVGVGDTETEYGSFLVGAGQYTFCCSALCRYLDLTGGTGVQNLVLRAAPLQNTSDIYGELAVNQLALT